MFVSPRCETSQPRNVFIGRRSKVIALALSKCHGVSGNARYYARLVDIPCWDITHPDHSVHPSLRSTVFSSSGDTVSYADGCPSSPRKHAARMTHANACLFALTLPHVWSMIHSKFRDVYAMIAMIVRRAGGADVPPGSSSRGASVTDGRRVVADCSSPHREGGDVSGMVLRRDQRLEHTRHEWCAPELNQARVSRTLPLLPVAPRRWSVRLPGHGGLHSHGAVGGIFWSHCIASHVGWQLKRVHLACVRLVMVGRTDDFQLLTSGFRCGRPGDPIYGTREAGVSAAKIIPLRAIFLRFRFVTRTVRRSPSTYSQVSVTIRRLRR